MGFEKYASPEIFTGGHAPIKHILDDGMTCLRPAELSLSVGLGHGLKATHYSGHLDGENIFEDQTFELLNRI
ncbi:hypothetical protein TNCV_3822671 [Trichonephila clavipes]|nr:hypothetical protein TNCV_3822671 [Trichonephila clavipes]